MSLPSEGSKGSSSLDDASETNVSFSAKWGRVQFDVSLPRSSTVMDLKQQIQHQISVPAKKQKILGLNPKGKPPADEESLEFLPANKKHSIIIMGTVEEIVFEPTPSTDRDAEEVNHIIPIKSYLILFFMLDYIMTCCKPMYDMKGRHW
eukprot:TRINITY_DN1546_c0_g1_i3.p2 TRINITY_DN1546_c0_g1~~TRINITY_DN1546_c0_g1_i3.p2  ORF type:complete len:149 (-),score=35.17 TRINITY_DN1546_c0_g1_i3:1211-1657(-)